MHTGTPKHLFNLRSTHTGRLCPVYFWFQYGVTCPSEVTTNGSIGFFANWLVGHVNVGNYSIEPVSFAPDVTDVLALVAHLKREWATYQFEYARPLDINELTAAR